MFPKVEELIDGRVLKAPSLAPLLDRGAALREWYESLLPHLGLLSLHVYATEDSDVFTDMGPRFRSAYFADQERYPRDWQSSGWASRAGAQFA